MIVIVKGSFDRDTDKIRSKNLKQELTGKLLQIEKAKDISQITGLKLLRGYTHHYRIYVNTDKLKYRIGAAIRGDKIWLIRFLKRKVVYSKFP